MRTARVVEALRATSVFSDLDSTQLMMLAATGRTKTLERYGVLYREDAVSRCFYILLQGTLLASRAGAALPPYVARADAKGLTIGTEGLSHLPRHATLTAAEQQKKGRTL